MDPSRALSAILRVVITVVKGRQVAEIVRHLLHVHVFGDFMYPFLLSKVGPFCRDTSLKYPRPRRASIRYLTLK